VIRRPAIVRTAVIFYGLLLAVVAAWSIASGDSIFYASSDAQPRGWAWIFDAAIGAAAAAATIFFSERITSLTRWGEAMARALVEVMGKRTWMECMVLALASGVAEEAFFRGALQPRVGLVAASLIFAAAHFVPRRELLPWAGFALAAGLLLGGLFVVTGNLLAPIVAHVGINAVNLRRLGQTYG
jgi:membrane protease YdiL (CAAX protease family)